MGEGEWETIGHAHCPSGEAAAYDLDMVSVLTFCNSPLRNRGNTSFGIGDAVCPSQFGTA